MSSGAFWIAWFSTNIALAKSPLRRKEVAVCCNSELSWAMLHCTVNIPVSTRAHFLATFCHSIIQCVLCKCKKKALTPEQGGANVSDDDQIKCVNRPSRSLGSNQVDLGGITLPLSAISKSC